MNQSVSEIFLYACNFSGRGFNAITPDAFKIPAFVAYCDWGHAACKPLIYFDISKNWKCCLQTDGKISTFLTIENLKS